MMEEKGRNRKPEFFRQNASRGDVCTDSPSPSAAELIFVTNITNYICGEKIVMWRNVGKFWRHFGHTCKKRVMLRRRLFWPKKNCGKSA